MASGLMNTGAATALAAAIPNGTSVYVGLLTQMPLDATGAGLIEAAGSGYARIAFSTWLTTNSTSGSIRTNSGAITFAALSAALAGIVGFGIWSAITGGNLIACGLVNNGVAISFVSTDQPSFADQTLNVGAGVGA